MGFSTLSEVLQCNLYRHLLVQEHVISMVQQALREAKLQSTDISCIAYTKVNLYLARGTPPLLLCGANSWSL